MRTAGIIAEYNPFHRGHAWHIEETRRALGPEGAVVCVMSGHWVQGADCAITDKWTRTQLALAGGADLVLELPVLWALSSAERFARGGVEILAAAGVVNTLSFGSECGDVEALKGAATCLDTEEYRTALRRFLDEGLPFAVCRQRAVEELLDQEAGALLRKPNNNLGVEYLRALNRLGSPIEAMTVPRQGAPHNTRATAVLVRGEDGMYHSGPAAMELPRFASATQIRLDLMDGHWDLAEPYLLEGGRRLLEGNLIGLSALERVERAMLAKIRTMTEADWAVLPDSAAAEGLPARLCQAGRQAGSMKEFFEQAKTKRYTYARLQRLAVWAFLGLTAADMPEHPPYLRVLGFNSRGRAVLREMKEKAVLPVLTKAAHIQTLGEDARRLFALESRATDLYALCLERPWPCGREYTVGPVIIDASCAV